MARRQTGASGEGITCSIGQCPTVFGGGSGTSIAIIMRLTTFGANDCLFVAGSGADPANWQFFQLSVSQIALYNGSTTAGSPASYVAGGNWYMLGMTKTSGTTAPRFHKYTYGTDAHTHDTSGTSVANSGTAATSCYHGKNPNQVGASMIGDLAITGVWDRVLTDAEYEPFPFSLQAWYASTPKGLWLFDQDTNTQKVADLTGNGANETAISATSANINNVPVFGYGHDNYGDPFKAAAIVAGRPIPPIVVPDIPVFESYLG